MKHTTLALVSLVVLAIVLVGCRSNPVYNVERAPIHTGQQAPQLEDVRTAIVRAGTGLGWQMRDAGPGKMVGTLAIRKHVAVVDIDFDTTAYNINYKDSTELAYDGSSIHPNYNGWVQNLDRAIRVQLSAL